LLTGLAVVSLALGIGANTAVFSLLNAILLRPLPIRDPDRLVVITSADQRKSSWPQPVWAEIQDRQLLDGAFAWFWSRFDTAQGGERQFIDGIVASGRMFETLGLRPVIGRLLTPADDELEGAPDGPVAVLSYRFWQRRFGGTPDVLGRSLAIDGRPFTIVGVTPPDFIGLYIGLPLDVVIPFGRPGTGLGGPYVTIMGRLKRGATSDTATAALRVAQPLIRDATNPYSVAPYRDEYLRDPLVVRAARGGLSFLQRRYELALKILLGVAGFVLLIACGNIGMLLLARVMARRHEFGVRAALGASRMRVVWQLVLESLLLSAAGASLGILLSQWCTDVVVAMLSTQAYTVFLDLGFDWRVLGFTCALGLATALLFGAAPAVHAMRTTGAMDALKRRRMTEGRGFGFGSGIVVAQVALSLLLLVGAGLFLRTLINLKRVETGFNAQNLLLFFVEPGLIGYKDEKLVNLYRETCERLEALPGVRSVTFSRETLLSRVWGYDYFGGARTVDVHIRRLRAKLGEEHANLIQTVRSVGYSFGQSRWSM
jgi:predicted permease